MTFTVLVGLITHLTVNVFFIELLFKLNKDRGEYG